MDFYKNYNDLGKKTITTTRSEFTETIGEDGTRDIIKRVLLGGNVRDTTEFITQRRLLNSYASMLELFVNTFSGQDTQQQNDLKTYVDSVIKELSTSKKNSKIFDLWLLGLTKKGFDNIARGNLSEYRKSFEFSTKNAVADFNEDFGQITGNLELNGKSVPLSWEVLSLMLLAIGAQTLTLRGSSKSMNGKMFEKLVLGSILTMIGFEFCSTPPKEIDPENKIFWLSNMDENERETDATIVYNNKAVSIDIGFIGKGNPEITLDKVTRFGAYKRIGGEKHDMSTIIIVDTVADHSDLFNKAKRVKGKVLQMKHEDWTIQFANVLNNIFDLQLELSDLNTDDLEKYFESHLKDIQISNFIN